MDNRSARPRAKNLMFAVLAVGAAAVASGNLARGNDDPAVGESAATADDGTQRAAEPRKERRRTRKEHSSGETQAAAAERPVPTVEPVPTEPVPTVEIENAADADAQIVCRSSRRLGTRIQKSVCATAAEWKARSAQDNENVDTFARQAREAASIPPPAGVTPGRTPL